MSELSSLSIKELLEVKLPAALQSKTKEVRECNAKFLVNITGNGGGSWLLDGTETGPAVTPVSDKEKSDCSATISCSDFYVLLKEPSKAFGMLLTGKLKISGNKAKALSLTKYLKV